MTTYTITPNSANVNVRKDFTTSSDIIGKLSLGQVGKGSEVVERGSGLTYEKWVKIDSINGLPISGWVAAYYKTQGNLCTVTEETSHVPSDITTIEFSVTSPSEIFVIPESGDRIKIWPK